jgi:hypothetical protein
MRAPSVTHPSLLPASRCKSCRGDLSSVSPGARARAYYIHVAPADDGHRPEPVRTSVAQVRAGQLPESAGGVYWTDTDRIECADRLRDPSWTPGPHPDNDLPLGIVLFAEHDELGCDGCAEAARS